MKSHLPRMSELIVVVGLASSSCLSSVVMTWSPLIRARRPNPALEKMIPTHRMATKLLHFHWHSIGRFFLTGPKARGFREGVPSSLKRRNRHAWYKNSSTAHQHSSSTILLKQSSQSSLPFPIDHLRTSINHLNRYARPSSHERTYKLILRETSLMLRAIELMVLQDTRLLALIPIDRFLKFSRCSNTT